MTRTRRSDRPVADDEREQAPTAPAPVDAILKLQRSAGNAAVARWLRADSAAGSGGAAPAAEPSGPDSGYEGAEEEAEGDATPEATSGSIEDLEGAEIDTAGCDRPDDAGPPLRLRTNLTVVSGTSDAPAASRKSDAVGSTLNFGSKVKKGGASPNSSQFGVEKVKYKVDKMKWTHDAATSTVNAEARVFLTSDGASTASAGRTSPTRTSRRSRRAPGRRCATTSSRTAPAARRARSTGRRT